MSNGKIKMETEMIIFTGLISHVEICLDIEKIEENVWKVNFFRS